MVVRKAVGCIGFEFLERHHISGHHRKTTESAGRRNKVIQVKLKKSLSLVEVEIGLKSWFVVRFVFVVDFRGFVVESCFAVVKHIFS